MPRHTPHRAERLGRRALAPPEFLEHRNAPGAMMLLPPLAQAFANGAPECTPATIQQEKALRRSKPEKAAVAPAILTDDVLRIANQLAQIRPSSPKLSAVEAETIQSQTIAMASDMLAPVNSTVAAKLPMVSTNSPSPQETKPDKLPTLTVRPIASTAAAFGATGGGANISSSGGGMGGGSSGNSVAQIPAVATVPTVSSVVPSQSAMPSPAPSPAVMTAPAQSASPAPSISVSSTATIVPTATTTSSLPPSVLTTPAIVNQPSAAPNASPQAQTAVAPVTLSGPVIETAEVQQLLDRASAATSRNDAIIAVVDRNGRILGVRVEDGVSLDSDTLVFAIDGAVAKARTAAFFANGGAPITSRTVRFISQSTVTQREVESNPNISDISSPERGPGFVAPIGIGGHFPPGVMLTPHVDLFAIEHTNRDSIIHPGKDLIRGTNDDVNLMTRFGADFASGVDIDAPESYGKVSGLLPDAQSRGIATLPGGVPLFKLDGSTPTVVGGIGVFFPGPDGYATFEQNFVPGVLQNPQDRLNAPLVLEAEYTAFAAAGGVGTIAGIPTLANYVVPRGRIDLAGITLEIYGPHPMGEKGLVAFGQKLGTGSVNGTNQMVNTSGDQLLEGKHVPEGWLVEPRASAVDNLTEADVRKIIEDGVDAANRVRAAIRSIGSRTRMVLSVTDTTGEILGLYRMPDATVFSIDVAVAKARNVSYYSDPSDLQQIDRVDENFDGTPDVDAGVAFTNRTFRYLASPFFPTGVDTAGSGPFSILNNSTLIDPLTGENIGLPMPAAAYTGVLAYDAFNPGSNFHEMDDADAVIGNQNGVVFFPGSTPLYKDGVLVGGLGVSGDGVDQDDVVTFFAGGDFIPGRDSGIVRSDQTFVRNIRLPYQKFGRNLLA